MVDAPYGLPHRATTYGQHPLHAFALFSHANEGDDAGIHSASTKIVLHMHCYINHLKAFIIIIIIIIIPSSSSV